MAALTITALVTANGPLFNGPEAEHIIEDWLGEVKKDIAQEGVNRLKDFVMDKTGRGTGRYQSEIVTSTLNHDNLLLHDPMVYGPWLEGVSERNRSTRFKGYKLWRKTQDSLDADSGDIAERRMPELIDKLNGPP